jgi:leucyl aminopeptidase
MKANFTGYSLPSSGTLFLLATEGSEPERGLQALSDASRETVTRAMSASSFTGKRDESVTVFPSDGNLDRIVVIGVGKADAFDILAAETSGAAVASACKAAKVTKATILVEPIEGAKLDAAAAAARIALGASLRTYRFDQYRTKLTAEQKIGLEELDIGCTDTASASSQFEALKPIVHGVFLTRDVVSEPPNVIYPETLADRAKKELAPLGVEIEILDVAAMEKLGMGALLAVGMGSARPPKLLVMRWNGAAQADQQPIAFVGKGITFDTGGISIKPGPNMEDMKWDMGGSGTVIGLMAVLAGRKAKANVVGVAALAENMPDGAAYRPGDILTSMSGQTIEVHNTDAEGRLVLADALWYTQGRFKPKFMVDLATLTGACGIALGSEYAGLMTNDDDLAMKLVQAGHDTGELLWRLPLCEAFDKAIDSDVADMKNIAGNREAGSSIGGQFLKRFVNDTPWAHLDIAFLAWSKKDKGIVPKGATAFGVRLLDAFVAANWEG